MRTRSAAAAARTLELVEPERLEVVFGGEHAGVEEDHDDDEPVKRLRLDDASARLATVTIRHVHRPPTKPQRQLGYLQSQGHGEI